jgi:hypothetical protein
MERQMQHTAVDRGNFSPRPVIRESGIISADLEKNKCFQIPKFQHSHEDYP